MKFSVRWTLAVLLVINFIFMIVQPIRVSAAVSLIQTKTDYGTGTSLSATFAPAATAGNLLIVVCANNGTSTITGPSGYTAAHAAESGDISEGIFYKVAGGGETTTTCSYSSSSLGGIHIYEYSGIHTYKTLDAANTTSSSGSGNGVSSGSVTTTHPNDFIFATIANDGGIATESWSNSFTDQTTSGNGFGTGTSGKKSNRTFFDSAAFTASSVGTYSTVATLQYGGTANWRGQIVAFRMLAATQTVTADFVDGSGASVASPSATLSSTSPGFTCQTSTGSLGNATQKIRVTSTLDKGTWNLTMAATGGPTATWYAPPVGAVPARTYKFNDSTGSGCTYGQLTVNAAAGTLTPATNCTTTGIAKGASASFGGALNSITLLSGDNTSDVDCYWELIGVGLSQKIPPAQPGASYSINMTLTATAI